MKLFKRLLSYIVPVSKKTVVTTDEQTYEVPTKPPSQLTYVVYKPWKDAEYFFVGHAVKETEDGVRTLLRFQDPVTKKEFLLTEELANILLYRD